MVKGLGRMAGAAVVGGIAIFGGVTATGDDTTRDESGEIVEGGGLGVFAMQDGDCFILPDEEYVQSVEAVACTTPHDGQKFATVTVSYVGEYDEQAIYNSAGERCVAEFEDFVGQTWEQSELYLDAFYPAEDGWADGQREALCLIIPNPELGEMLTFDAEGSGR